MAGPEVTITLRGVDKASSVIKEIQDRLQTMAKTDAPALAVGMQNVEISLGQMNRVMGLLTDAIEKMGDGVKDVEKDTDKASTSFSKYGRNVVAVARKARAAILAIGSGIGKVGQDIGASIENILGGLGGKLSRVGAGGLGGNILSPIIDSVRTTVNMVAQGVVSVTKGTINALTSIVSGGVKVLGSLMDAMSSIFGGVLGLVAGGGGLGGIVGVALGSVFGAIPKAMSQALSGIVEGAGAALGGVADLIGGVFQAGVNIAAQALNGLLTIVQGVVSKIGEAFGGLVEKIGGVFGEVASKASMVLLGMTAFAARASIKFRDQMAVTFGLVAEEGPAAFKTMVSEVREIMADTPFIPWEEGAKGLFQAISFGIRDPIARIEALKAATDLAVGGGMRDLGTAMQSIARLMDLFGISASEAADRMFTFQNQASLTVGDLALGLGQVMGTAKLAGQSLDEMGASLTFLSRALPPEMSFIALNSILLTFMESDAAQKFKEIGVSIRDATGAMLPFSEIVSQLKDANLGDIALRELFPNRRAFRGMPALLNATTEEFNAMLKSMGEFEGAAGSAAAVVRQQLGATISRTWSGFTAVVDQVIEQIQGPLVSALNMVGVKLQEFRGSEAFDTMVQGILDMGSAIHSSLGSAFGFIKRNWDEIQEKATDVWSVIEDIAVGVFNIIMESGEAAKALSGPDGAFVGIKNTWIDIMKVVREFREAMGSAAAGDFDPLKAALGGVWEAFSTAADRAWRQIKVSALDALADMSEGLARMLLGFAQRTVGGGGSGGDAFVGGSGEDIIRNSASAGSGADVFEGGGGSPSALGVRLGRAAGEYVADAPGNVVAGLKEYVKEGVDEVVGLAGAAVADRAAGGALELLDLAKEIRELTKIEKIKLNDEKVRGIRESRRLADERMERTAQGKRDRERRNEAEAATSVLSGFRESMDKARKALEKSGPQGGSFGGGGQADALRVRMKNFRDAEKFKDPLLAAEKAGAGPQEFDSPRRTRKEIRLERLREQAQELADRGLGGIRLEQRGGVRFRQRGAGLGFGGPTLGQARDLGSAQRQLFGGRVGRQERLQAQVSKLGAGGRKEARGILEESKAAGLDLPIEAVLQSARKGGRATEAGREVLAQALERQAAALEAKAKSEGDEFQKQAERTQLMAEAIRESKDANEGLMKSILDALERMEKDMKDKAARDREHEQRVKNLQGGK